jgi:hypothetical protein
MHRFGASQRDDASKGANERISYPKTFASSSSRRFGGGLKGDDRESVSNDRRIDRSVSDTTTAATAAIDYRPPFVASPHPPASHSRSARGSFDRSSVRGCLTTSDHACRNSQRTDMIRTYPIR